MARDPAILFYYQDFIFGTSFMTNEQVGAYIRILCYLADKGNLKEEHIRTICATPEVFNVVIEKLERNGDDSYHQKRLTEEVIKRKKFTESRKKNRVGNNICETYDSHMENENEDINEIKNKEKEQNFKSEVLKFNYPLEMLNEFITYWTEPNKSRTKLRYELEKTWDMARRLNTWAKNDKVFKKTPGVEKFYKRKETEIKDEPINIGEMPERLQRLANTAVKKFDKKDELKP